jgi:replication factor C subunit 2/4
LIHKRVLELNASNERGIDIIRTKVKEFASIAVSTSEKTPGFPCPPFKIIILDEADSMTRDAQSALRRTMEQYSKVTRFCIICNYVSRIIEPITSRCAKFRYKPLSSQSMIQRLQYIGTQEKLYVHPEAYETLVTVSDGDMRRAITLLQSAQRLVLKDEQLQSSHVIEVAGVVPAAVIENLMKSCKTSVFNNVQNQVKEIIYSAYPADAIFQQLLPTIINDDTISDLSKGYIMNRIAEVDAKLIDGGDEYLQLLDVASYIAKTIVTA